jgi:hypothetical protein
MMPENGATGMCEIGNGRVVTAFGIRENDGLMYGECASGVLKDSFNRAKG